MQTSDNQAPLIVAKPGGRVFSKYLPPQEEKTILKKATIGAMSLHLLVYFVSISMRHVYLHVYLHVPCVCACNTCMLHACNTCILHACAMCFSAPSLCQREASLSAHDTSVASALEGEMPCHDMSATCLLIRCSSHAHQMPPHSLQGEMPPHQDAS